MPRNRSRQRFIRDTRLVNANGLAACRQHDRASVQEPFSNLQPSLKSEKEAQRWVRVAFACSHSCHGVACRGLDGLMVHLSRPPATMQKATRRGPERSPCSCRGARFVALKIFHLSRHARLPITALWLPSPCASLPAHQRQATEHL